jgi:hypothetical protein
MSENLNELPFDMDEFINGLVKDSQREFQVSDRAQKVLMNLKDNQGNIMLVPIISKKIGNIYCKLEHVREYKAMSSVIDSDDPVWYKILPKEIYELNESQSQLYDEVTGLFDQVMDYEAFDYTEMRVRNYSLFTGVCLGHDNLDGNKVEENINQPVLLIFPSTSPINALNTAIAKKKQTLGDKTPQWLTGIITPRTVGRKGAIQISFKKSAGPGYESSISFEVNNPSDFTIIVDEKRDFADEAKKFEDPVSSFIGWMNDQNNDSRFNETVFRELRDQLKVTLNELKLQNNPQELKDNTENKNGVDPMLNNPPIPGVDQTTQPQPEVKSGRPF